MSFVVIMISLSMILANSQDDHEAQVRETKSFFFLVVCLFFQVFSFIVDNLADTFLDKCPIIY